MPERRTARTGRRPVVRERSGRRADSRRQAPEDQPEDLRAEEAGSADAESEDELPGEDREPEDEPADEEPQDEAAGEPEEEPAAEEDEFLDEEEEPADERDAPRRRPAGRRNRDGGMSAAEAARSGLRSLTDLIGKRPQGITEVAPTDDGWRIGIEVVEDPRVPSTADILAIYQAQLDADGRLLSYRRIRRYPRGRGDDGGER